MSKWILITGASQGIGYEFTRLFAADGHDLVLVARDEARLQAVAQEMTARHGVKTKVLAKDLAGALAAREIFEELQREQIHVSILVNNAGFGTQGLFAEVDLQRHTDLMQVNMAALVQLTHLFLKPMLARGEGRILNVASVASFMAGPFLAMYYASKAFVHSFSQALAKELDGSGVTVTTVYPGLTQSQFHARAGISRPENFVMMDAGVVAKMGYQAMLKGKPMVVTGWMNKLLVGVARLLPMRVMLWTVARANRSKLQAAHAAAGAKRG